MTVRVGRVKQANLNGYVTLQTQTIQPGTYGVIVWFKKASNAGRFRLAVGTSGGLHDEPRRRDRRLPLVGAVDEGQPRHHHRFVRGRPVLQAQYFKLTATSKNGSSSGYWTFIDAIQLYKTN